MNADQYDAGSALDTDLELKSNTFSDIRKNSDTTFSTAGGKVINY